MQWKELSALAREMAATPPADRLHQTKLRLAVSTVYYAMYHALAGSNADLLIGPSETEGSPPEWHRVYAALGGDSAFELMQADFSRHPEAVGRFVDAFLAMHYQRLRAEEDPVVTYSAAETQGWIQRVEVAIAEFLSVDPEQRRAFALELLPVHLSEQ